MGSTWGRNHREGDLRQHWPEAGLGPLTTACALDVVIVLPSQGEGRDEPQVQRQIAADRVLSVLRSGLPGDGHSADAAARIRP